MALTPEIRRLAPDSARLAPDSARQADVEGAAAAGAVRFDPDLAAVRFDDHSADVEAQADSLRRPAEPGVDAVEPLEDASVLIAGDANALVAHEQHDVVALDAPA